MIYEVMHDEMFSGLADQMKTNSQAYESLMDAKAHLQRSHTYSVVAIALLAVTFAAVTAEIVTQQQQWSLIGVAGALGSLPFSFSAMNQAFEANASLIRAMNQYNGDSYTPSETAPKDHGLRSPSGVSIGLLSLSF